MFNKSKKYAISSLFINQDTTAYIPLRNVQGQKALSHILQTYSEGKKFNLELRIYREGLFDITVQFAKRKDALINGFQYYNSTTKIPKLLNFTTTIIILKILALDGPTRSST